ncbi:MAG TPA: POTRA domain-containing protein [Polyangia bacterium]
MNRPRLILLPLSVWGALAAPSARAAEIAATPAPVPIPAPASAPTLTAPTPPPTATPGAPASKTLAPVETAAASGAIIARYDVTGILVEPRETIESLLKAVAPTGTPFVASGPADRIGTPIGTLPRLRRALEGVGYDAAVDTQQTGADSLTIRVRLRPYDRVRYFFVKGNGTIRQDEIQRRITIRTGHPLPMPGPERDAAVERERQRLIRFLRDEEGYFDANVGIELVSHGATPAAVDFHVRISRGSGYPIGPIAITGNNAFPAEDIDKTFRHPDPLRLWTSPVPFTVRRMRDDIAKVVDRYRAQGYLGARITSSFDPEHSVDTKNKNVAIALRVNERKHITIAFEGNHSKSNGTLKEHLTLTERGAYDDYEASNSADALQQYYQDQGFFFARVQWQREKVAAEEERLVFTIDEGPELKVRAVEFMGNKQLSSDDLAETVTVRTFPFLGYIGLGSGGFVTARQVELDAERLIEHYRSLGFPDVQAFGEVSTSRDTFGMAGAAAAGAETVARDAKEIFVRFTIDEGVRVKVVSEDFVTTDNIGLPYGPAYLREVITQRIGSPYRPGFLKEDTRHLERALGDIGYPAANAEPTLERQGADIHIIWKIKMGPRVQVGPIFVRGNFVTKPETILEQIPIKSGDYLTTTAFERGQRNLGYLQLFNNASPISFPGKEEGLAVVPMVVEVEERHDQYNVVHVGGGGSTEQASPNSSFPLGWYVRAGYDNRNLFGHGWNLTTSAEYGQSLVRVNSTFLDRRFLGTLFRFDISGQYFQQATVRLGDIRSWGGSIGFGREMYPGVDASIHYNLRNTTHTEALLPVAGPYEQQNSVTLGTAVGSLSFDLQWLRLDNRLIPTRGFKFEAVTEVAPRSLSFGYADVSFVKLGLRATVVVPIFRWLMLRHSARYDQGFPLGNESLLPKVERYFAGGETTLRGFKLDRARVETVSNAGFGGPLQDSYVQYRPIGGNLRVVDNIDLQFPISPPWYGSVFFDNGVVADSFNALAATSFRHDVGVSPIIIKIPVGDLSFAWAWPLDPGPGDTRIGVFLVNIGLLY